MPITAPTPDIHGGERQSAAQDDDERRPNALAIKVGEIVRSTLGPRGPDRGILDEIRGSPPTLILLREEETTAIKMNPQTEAANFLSDLIDLDDNADLIDENSGVLDVTLEDGGDALDCGVCYLPLKPPIFQCDNGHVLCFPCRRKIEATGNNKCHVCRVDLYDLYDYDSRCHAMERVVESIRVPCPNATYGCAARLTYYNRSSHRKACPHAQYSCSGYGCGFVGSAGALLDHVASVHTATNEAMQHFWTEELSSLMARLKLRMAAADIGIAGVGPQTIELVMSHASVSMDKAVKALKESSGDLVTAIMELTI